MGIGEKKCLSYPRENLKMGTGKKKMLSYPKESLGMGTVSFIPKGKFKNGYRKKKWIEIPKRKGKWTGNLLLENEIGKI